VGLPGEIGFDCHVMPWVSVQVLLLNIFFNYIKLPTGEGHLLTRDSASRILGARPQNFELACLFFAAVGEVWLSQDLFKGTTIWGGGVARAGGVFARDPLVNLGFSLGVRLLGPTRVGI